MDIEKLPEKGSRRKIIIDLAINQINFYKPRETMKKQTPHLLIIILLLVSSFQCSFVDGATCAFNFTIPDTQSTLVLIIDDTQQQSIKWITQVIISPPLAGMNPITLSTGNSNGYCPGSIHSPDVFSSSFSMTSSGQPSSGWVFNISYNSHQILFMNYCSPQMSFDSQANTCLALTTTYTITSTTSIVDYFGNTDILYPSAVSVQSNPSSTTTVTTLLTITDISGNVGIFIPSPTSPTASTLVTIYSPTTLLGFGQTLYTLLPGTVSESTSTNLTLTAGTTILDASGTLYSLFMSSNTAPTQTTYTISTSISIVDHSGNTDILVPYSNLNPQTFSRTITGPTSITDISGNVYFLSPITSITATTTANPLVVSSTVTVNNAAGTAEILLPFTVSQTALTTQTISGTYSVLDASGTMEIILPSPTSATTSTVISVSGSTSILGLGQTLYNLLPYTVSIANPGNPLTSTLSFGPTATNVPFTDIHGTIYEFTTPSSSHIPISFTKTLTSQTTITDISGNVDIFYPPSMVIYPSSCSQSSENNNTQISSVLGLCIAILVTQLLLILILIGLFVCLKKTENQAFPRIQRIDTSPDELIGPERKPSAKIAIS